MMACNVLIFTKKSEQVLTLEMTSPKSSGFNYVTNQQPHHHECENIIKFNCTLQLIVKFPIEDCKFAMHFLGDLKRYVSPGILHRQLIYLI